jgi:hypothetical protein
LNYFLRFSLAILANHCKKSNCTYINICFYRIARDIRRTIDERQNLCAPHAAHLIFTVNPIVQISGKTIAFSGISRPWLSPKNPSFKPIGRDRPIKQFNDPSFEQEHIQGQTLTANGPNKTKVNHSCDFFIFSSCQ